jgi:hypothetical protein
MFMRLALAAAALAAMTAAALAQDGQRPRTMAPAVAPAVRELQRLPAERTPTRPQTGTAEIMLPFSAERATRRYQIIDGRAIMQGDIILGRVDAAGRLLPSTPPGDRPHTSGGYGVTSSPLTATAGNYWRWRDGRVPFEIPNSLPAATRIAIRAAIRDIDENTNVTFVERNGESDYITFEMIESDTKCGESPLGMQDGGNTIELTPACDRGSIEHEIMHSLGAFHEQARADRDRYVRINWGNIIDGQEDQFESHAHNGVDIGPYDFGSIMHYPQTAFGITEDSGFTAVTIEMLDGSAPYDTQGRTCVRRGASHEVRDVIGQRNCLSAYDIAAINAMYPMVAGFSGGQSWGQEYYATKIAFGDIDGDGRDEIAVARYADQNARVFVYDDALANYAVLWTFGAEWGSGNYATSVEFGNVDADPAEELGITRRADTGPRAWIVHRASNGSFAASPIGNSAQWGAGNYATDIAFGNVDADGRDEVAIARHAGENARFFLYDDAVANHGELASGGANWGGNSYATAAAFGDVDADGKEELAIGRMADEHGRYFVYGYVPGTGLRRFTTGGDQWGDDAYVTDLAFGQFDADPAKELGVVRNTRVNDRYFVFDDAAHNYRQLLAGGAGWGSGYYATGIAFGDVDRDGRDEIAVSRYARQRERFWLIDDAQGSFLELYAGGNRWGDDTYATSVALGDVTGDRCADFGVTRNARANMRFDIVTTGACAGRRVINPAQPNRPVVRRNP